MYFISSIPDWTTFIFVLINNYTISILCTNKTIRQCIYEFAYKRKYNAPSDMTSKFKNNNCGTNFYELVDNLFCINKSDNQSKRPSWTIDRKIIKSPM